MPARYMDEASAINSMVADGCIINGRVEHSVIFRGVKIAKGATVKNCVIMQDARIDEGVYLENCILDKQAHIQKDGRLIGPELPHCDLQKHGDLIRRFRRVRPSGGRAIPTTRSGYYEDPVHLQRMRSLYQDRRSGGRGGRAGPRSGQKRP